MRVVQAFFPHWEGVWAKCERVVKSLLKRFRMIPGDVVSDGRAADGIGCRL